MSDVSNPTIAAAGFVAPAPDFMSAPSGEHAEEGVRGREGRREGESERGGRERKRERERERGRARERASERASERDE